MRQLALNVLHPLILLCTSSQYTEQILPILVFAQQRLKDRIIYYGPLIKNQSELIIAYMSVPSYTCVLT